MKKYTLRMTSHISLKEYVYDSDDFWLIMFTARAIPCLHFSITRNLDGVRIAQGSKRFS